jgi:hypothetical protein
MNAWIYKHDPYWPNDLLQVMQEKQAQQNLIGINGLVPLNEDLIFIA